MDLVSQTIAAIEAAIGPAREPVPLHEPEFAGREWDYVKDCLDTGWVSSVGAYVDRLEDMMCAYTGAGSAVATVNGTAALHIALMLAGVEPDDEVLVPALTFIASANAVSYCGARAHFVDCEAAALGVDAAKLADYLQDIAAVKDGICRSKRTGQPIRALLCVHILGHPCDVDALTALCDRWRIALVEDAAESLGSLYRGRHTGTFGRLGALSFNGNKITTTGGGGAVLTNDPELAARAKHLTTTARIAGATGFVHDDIGYNYRMPNINAALGCAQLERIDDFVARKRDLAARYRASFADLDPVTLIEEPMHCRSNYWLNGLVLGVDHADQRDSILAATNAAGWMTRPAWTPMHQLAPYADCPRMDLSTVEDMYRRLVCLPSSPALAAAPA